MNVRLHGNLRFDIQGLAQAIAHCQASDALSWNFSSADWEILASYMHPFALGNVQVLFEQGSIDTTLYFVESRARSVRYKDDKARIRITLVSSGSVVGEGEFFSHQPRSTSK